MQVFTGLAETGNIMNLSELLSKSATTETTKVANVEVKKVKSDEIEKLASVLEGLAEEDTLLDDLARTAVIADMLEKQYGQKGNA